MANRELSGHDTGDLGVSGNLRGQVANLLSLRNILGGSASRAGRGSSRADLENQLEVERYKAELKGALNVQDYQNREIGLDRRGAKGIDLVETMARRLSGKPDNEPLTADDFQKAVLSVGGDTFHYENQRRTLNGGGPAAGGGAAGGGASGGGPAAGGPSSGRAGKRTAADYAVELSALSKRLEGGQPEGMSDEDYDLALARASALADAHDITSRDEARKADRKASKKAGGGSAGDYVPRVVFGGKLRKNTPKIERETTMGALEETSKFGTVGGDASINLGDSNNRNAPGGETGNVPGAQFSETP